jgi:hypothetical protein
VFLSVPCLPCLPRASGSAQAQAQSWSFTHPDTTASPHIILRQTYRHTLLRRSSAPFSSPAWTSFSLPFSLGVWITLPVLLHTAASSTTPPHHQPDNRLTEHRCQSFQKNAACLQLSPRPTSLRHVLCGPPAGHCGGIQVIKIAAFQLFHGTHESRRSEAKPPPPLLSLVAVARCVFLCHLNVSSSP